MTVTLQEYKQAMRQRPKELIIGHDTKANITTEGNIHFSEESMYNPFPRSFLLNEHEAYDVMVWLQGLGLRPRPVPIPKRKVKRVSPWWKFWNQEYKLVEE